MPKRTHVTEADKISKLRKYKDTQNNKFNSCGTGIYRRLRRDFFKTCKSQGILLDVLFNYQNQDGVGLVTKDRYGPHDLKVLKNANSRKPTVLELPANTLAYHWNNANKKQKTFWMLSFSPVQWQLS